MQDRHTNPKQYFEEQVITSERYVIPYIQEIKSINAGTTVLEIGCGEGGNLVPFLKIGCVATGIDLSKEKIESGLEIFKSHPKSDKLKLIHGNIYERSDLGIFDIVFLRDVIEHLPDQEKFMNFLKHFIHKDSVVFFGFPPWQNPFGGHQQICHGKVLSRLPWFHLLPGKLYPAFLKLCGESERTIADLKEIKETRISIERFERIVKKNGFQVLQKTHYFINPNYETKFGLKPRKQLKLISSIPYLRNFLTTAVYYVIGMK